MKVSKNNAVKQIAVIGGGASGLVAAIFSARQAVKCGKKIEITIYEANARVGKKILATGNGRCNYTNEHISAENFHGETELACSVIEKFSGKDTVNFFRELGLYPKSDFAGRIYPMSFQASSVLDALRYEVEKLGIKVQTETKITGLERKNNGFLLNGTYFADKCIIASGGKAASVHGSDGSGFLLLKPFGVQYNNLLPALTAVQCENFPKALKGIRAQGTITVKSNGKVLACDSGEIQFTDYGLSGIPTMQISRFVSVALDSGNKEVFAYLDLCPAFSQEQLKQELMSIISNNGNLPGEMLLSGVMPKRLGITILTDNCINPERNIGKLHSAVVEKIAASVKNKKYRIVSVKGFNDAQVTCGGIKASEINSETMELIKIKGIHICGEMVDVDGDCGGYNLQWAWSSGAVAGMSCVREI